MPHGGIPARPFGEGGALVTRVGLGGEGVLRTQGRFEDARAVIGEALAQGIGYYDSAPAYAMSQDYLGRIWGLRPDLRGKVMQAGKSAARDRQGALSDLMESLNRLRVDSLDLWQIHDVRTEEDLRAIEGKGGALEAFLAAREQGLARRIGVTGHHDPAVLTQAVRNWPVDAVLLPVNPVEAALGGFLDQTLPAALERGMAVIGMKALGAGHYLAPQAGITARLLLRFALAQPVSLVVVGCANPGEVAELAEAGREDEPMDPDEAEAMVGLFRPRARRLAYYRGAF